MRPRRLSLTIAVVLAAGAFAAAPAANATTPGVPTGVHVVAPTSHSFTVVLDRAPRTLRYVLFASHTKSDITYTHLSSPRPSRKSVSSSRPRLTLSGLPYSTATYYYRVETRNGASLRLSTIRETHLAPSIPTGLTLHPQTLALTWNLGAASDYDVLQATNPRFTRNVKRYALQGQATEFTPYGLQRGVTYYFKVRARNVSSSSRYSPAVSTTCTSHEQPVRVLTYNVLHKMFDGTHEGGNTIAPWSQRLPKIVDLIESGAPDVAAIEEASDWVVQEKVRAIDTIHARLSGYALAHTETLPNPRTGNYILYKQAEYRPVGAGGHWTISFKNWAAFQKLENRQTGAQFLMVAVHLSHGGNSVDAKRAAETKKLLAGARARADGLPIVYAGDFNSYSGPDRSVLDSPERVLRANHVGDGLVAAQSRHNTQYGSVNAYTRIPSHSGRIIDHVFGTAGVALRRWNQLLHLSHGRFVGAIPSDHNPVVVDASIRY